MKAKHRPVGMLTLAVSVLIAITSHAAAQSGVFEWTNLVSDVPGVAQGVDPNLVNPWGIVVSSGGTIWIARQRHRGSHAL